MSMRKRSVGAALRLLLLAAVPLAAHAQAKPAPSFNCDGATIESEKAICSDPQLARLDQRLAKVWNSYLDNFDDGRLLKILRGDQAAWLAQRDACGPESACIGSAYAERYGLITGQQASRRFAGVYQSPSGTMTVYPAKDGSYLVGIMTSDVGRGAWSCVVAGVGSGSGNLLTAMVGADFLEVFRDGAGMKIESNKPTWAVEQKNCGLNGSISSTYR